MDRYDERDLDRDADAVEDVDDVHDVKDAGPAHEGESHATTGGAAAAGAVTGGVIGLAGGPVGAALGAIGGAIVGVAAERMMHSDDDAERAQAGLDNDGDDNPLVEDRAEADARITETTYETAPTAQTRDRMQLREEQLQARTTPVQTGHVSLGKDVVEEQRTMDVPVKREEAVVERHAVERRPTDQPIGEGERSVDMPVHEERVTTEKQPVVYEKIGVDKRKITATQQVSDTVRREEARINTEGDANVREDDTSL
jgi:uncharacterized protein (TIGR02271 family)